MQDMTLKAVQKALTDAVPKEGRVDMYHLAKVATETMRAYREDMLCGLSIDQIIWLIDDYRERTGKDVLDVPTASRPAA